MEKKMKECTLQAEEERRNAEQIKDQVGCSSLDTLELRCMTTSEGSMRTLVIHSFIKTFM